MSEEDTKQYIDTWPQNWPQRFAFTIVVERRPFLATWQCCVFNLSDNKIGFQGFYCLSHFDRFYLAWNQFDEEIGFLCAECVDVEPNHKNRFANSNKPFAISSQRNEPDLSLKCSHLMCAICVNWSLFWLYGLPQEPDSFFQVRILWPFSNRCKSSHVWHIKSNHRRFYEIMNRKWPKNNIWTCDK